MDDDDARPAPNAFDGKHLLVSEARCDECLFTKGRVVSELRKRDILKHCYREGSYFICHKASLKGRAVICRGFAESQDGAGNQAIQVAKFLGCIRYVDPATGEPSVATTQPERQELGAGQSLRELVESEALTRQPARRKRPRRMPGSQR